MIAGNCGFTLGAREARGRRLARRHAEPRRGHVARRAARGAQVPRRQLRRLLAPLRRQARRQRRQLRRALRGAPLGDGRRRVESQGDRGRDHGDAGAGASGDARRRARLLDLAARDPRRRGRPRGAVQPRRAATRSSRCRRCSRSSSAARSRSSRAASPAATTRPTGSWCSTCTASRGGRSSSTSWCRRRTTRWAGSARSSSRARRRTQGVRLHPQFTTNELALHLKLGDTFIFDEMPTWRERAHRCPSPSARARLRDPAVRAQLAAEFDSPARPRGRVLVGPARGRGGARPGEPRLGRPHA